jgi:hypothetical protein
MHVSFDAALTRIATKRAKRDKDGVVVEEPAVSVTVEVPVSAISPGSLGALLRALDRGLRVDLDDGQRAFDLVERDGEPALVAEPAR